MTQTYTAIGLMSGTSMDGVDLALIRTDGQHTVERLGSSFTPYSDEIRAVLRPCLGKNDRPQQAIDMVTDAHIAAVKAFLQDHPRPDLVGFHGQTVFHDPANGITIQLGDGQRMAHELGIDVVFDFRSADVAAGGQGAPLIPLYHQVLARSARLREPTCLLNLGGVGNLTWIDGDTVIACDTGPGNALIDDWMLKNTGQKMDEGGLTAMSGKPDIARIQQWLQHPYFAKPAPKSLDRDAWKNCDVSDLSLEDGAATLATFTAQSVLRTLALMPSKPNEVIVMGGGRHNSAIMRALGSAVPFINADVLNWPGDSIEAEGFAYLAVRSKLGLPLSLPTTTGVPHPMTGGQLAKAA